KLEKWLQSPPAMLQKQYEIQKLRQDGTGLWFLNGAMFTAWQDNPGVLWIEGASGSGKSVLSSSIVKKLNDDGTRFHDLGHSSAIAFFYFDVNRKDSHMVDTALRRIVLQLSAQSPNSYRALEKRYSPSKGQITPNFQDLQSILEELLKELGRTYIVLDALDECEEQQFPQLLHFISNLRAWSESPLHLLITSQHRTIFDEFTNLPHILLEPNMIERDIHAFISHEVQNNPGLKLWRSRAGAIIEQVAHRSSGMFRLAACLLLELSRCGRSMELDETLRDLPADLFGIYDRFFKRIRPKDLACVISALRWLLFSRKSLQLTQLADAISFDLSNSGKLTYMPVLKPENIDAIPGWLEGLATVHHHNGDPTTVLLAHASVQDYLLSSHFTQKFGVDLDPGHSHSFIARGCIAYLDHTLGNKPYPPGSLMTYAPYNWCYHVSRAMDRASLLFPVMQLLEDKTRYLALDHILKKKQVIDNHLDNLGPVKTPIALCTQLDYAEGVLHLLHNGADVNQFRQHKYLLGFAVENESTELVKILLDHGADSIHVSYSLTIAAAVGHIGIFSTLLARGGQVRGDFGNTTALFAAANNGHTEIVQLLLKHGAEVDPKGDSGPLFVAAEQGYTEILQLLLDQGSEVNSFRAATTSSPLQEASLNGHTQAVQLLLNYGAKVNPDNDGEMPLDMAASNGHTEIVQLLLKHGADVNLVIARPTPLQLAANYGHLQTVQLLLDHGAEVNPGKTYKTPLQVAASNGHTETVQLLLNHGAEVNTDNNAPTPLQLASSSPNDWEGYTQTVQLLLNHGAQVNPDNNYKAPLQTAAWYQHRQIVQLLLDHGAELNPVNAQETPLQAAISGKNWGEPDGNAQTAKLLLDHGAEVNPIAAARTQSPSPLQVASLTGDTETVQLLLDHGAEVNPVNMHRTPLQAASWNGHTQTVQLLLAHGAEVNPNNTMATPLQAAASNGRLETVQLLLNHGAVVNPVNAQETPLQGASSRRWSGHTQTVKLLLTHGAEVDPVSAAGTPLQIASLNGCTETVQLLLDHSAEVNPVNTHKTPLQAASSKGHTQIVQLLLEHGADVAQRSREHSTVEPLPAE
ncbi:ankyrin repeat-containing domain protein, partial [Mycena filopes]